MNAFKWFSLLWHDLSNRKQTTYQCLKFIERKSSRNEIAKHFRMENVFAPNGWIDHFCWRFDSVFTVFGESKNVCPETTKHWTESILSSITKNYALKTFLV